MSRKKGFRHSEATKKKIRDTLKRKGIKPPLPFFNNIGKYHPNWKGGKTLLVKRIRGLRKYWKWRLAIFQRDDFTCQICKKRKSIRLVADHYPESFSKILDKYKIKTIKQALSYKELWKVNIGRTLCKECHQLTDNFGWKSIIKKPPQIE